MNKNEIPEFESATPKIDEKDLNNHADENRESERPETFSREWENAIIEKIKIELELIKPSLKNFVEMVMKEEPDILVILDKGARLFGTPLKKLFQELDLPKIPKIAFYNDDGIKRAFLEGNIDEGFVMQEFSGIKDKKVFFLDETFSEGKGALAIQAIKKILKKDDLFYFSLTKDERGEKSLAKRKELNAPVIKVPIDIYLSLLEELRNDPNFILSEIEHPYLLSKMVAGLYATQIDIGDLWTRTVHTSSKRLQKLAKLSGDSPLGKSLSQEEKEEELGKIKKHNEGISRLVGKVKAEIFKTLKGLEIKRENDHTSH